MPLNLRQGARVGAYVFRKKVIQGRKRFPLVLQLDPLFDCNLRCLGCGRSLDDPSEVHHTDVVADVLDHSKIVRTVRRRMNKVWNSASIRNVEVT